MYTNKVNKKLLLIPALLLLAGGTTYYFANKNNKPTAINSSTSAPSTPPIENKQTTGFNKSELSTTDPSSIWVVVNKQLPLQPKDYAPTHVIFPNIPLRVPGNESMQLRSETATAMEKMFQAASADGIKLMLSSGYRSYAYQVTLYGGYVAKDGQTSADTYSARPGHSEHQTGLGADIEPASRNCEVDQCFGTTPEGKWLAANAYKYGFIIRYPEDKVAITGYKYEPWHVRYIGEKLALEMHNQKISTLEEFFELPPAPNY